MARNIAMFGLLVAGASAALADIATSMKMPGRVAASRVEVVVPENGVLVDHLGAVPADAIALYGQGFASQIFGDFPDFNIAMIDDLTVSGSARSVSSAEYIAFFSDATTVPGDIASYQFEVYSSDAAATASITGDICSVSVAVGAAIATDITAPGNLPTWLYELPITGCSLAPGSYTFAVLTVMDFGPNGQTFSNASDLTVVGTDSNSKQTNPGGGFGLPGNIQDCVTDLGPICNAPYRVTAGGGADPCPADLSGDGFVGQDDLNLLLAAFNSGPGGDINGDGQTNQDDLNLLLAAFNTPCP